MTAKPVILALCAALALSACGKPGERMRFNGNYYPADLKKVGDRREDFVITVRDPGQGIEGAREAGRFEATRYCVETFGDSTVNWQTGYDPDANAAVMDNGRLILRGSCVIW
ncbi:hypothetical protein [Roseovarius nanhaiticus]|uniref:Lipoprotein n=1 Tax=Roseovarius nanhaiticus TaxID=573024 RepID=A0A1N7HF21_9RHOB|nr:hypothetical protein [Roseovarius nanhaiticus]SEK99329.1 hypothetical protein SAMN05216208_2450 [Roseovarius nanhaiticus]SIS23318.1 hypothetical protein SAMN05421666_2865 [Roseovarius nanhaiticus]